MDLTKTVWMGNIYHFMDEDSIRSLLMPLSTSFIKFKLYRQQNNKNKYHEKKS